MNTDHVQCYTCEVSCNHCGLAPTLDAMSAVALIDVVRGFLLMHRRCEKPVEPSKQVELFDALAAKEAGREIPIICVVCNGPLKDGEDPLTHLDQCRRKARSAADMETEDECSARTVREEMRKAIERGKELAQGIDGMSDEPDPETDPPGPMARHGEGLMLSPGGLHQLITAARPREYWPSLSDVESWHSDVRADVQRWCRVELAHKHPIAGLPLPPRFPMPNVLQNVEFTKPKRGARPLSSPVQLRRQEYQDAKAQRPSPKKRRSGSTAET